MPKIFNLKSFTDDRGSLTVLEHMLPFDIKRVFYIYDIDDTVTRGGHRHKKTIQALICLSGSCEVYTNNGCEEGLFMLDKPDVCLVLNPEDRHTMKFTGGSILLVLASENFDPDDYIQEVYTV